MLYWIVFYYAILDYIVSRDIIYDCVMVYYIAWCYIMFYILILNLISFISFLHICFDGLYCFATLILYT